MKGKPAPCPAVPEIPPGAKVGAEILVSPGVWRIGNHDIFPGGKF